MNTKMKYGLRLSTVRKLEDELYDYKNYDKRIHLLREDIFNPWIPTDTNTGGEHKPSNTSITEMRVTNYLTDIRIARIKELSIAIERVFNTSTQKEKDFIKHYYFDPRGRTYVQVCNDIFIGERTGHRIKAKVIKKLAEELGEW
ncbi:transcriptional regulator [Mammaliicoccus sciuri]|uniref:transcriptional regulator n=1 Tax=Mammaliicoccus sciuri TaxID=1296 RepID=UPI001C6349F4|nr:transcriptional regulator [Mammaliicoccus sciuri]QYG31598.1 transcriptional regulator [Mammaliicoccus sciuri]UXV31703.1 transcriptional regulator [Mammaliicoccus sciuri]